MNAEPVRISARPYAPRSFKAFRVVALASGHRTYPIPLDPMPATLAEAVDQAKLRCDHKDTLVLLASDEERGAETRHLFAIKRKSTPTYVYRDHQEQQRIQHLYAAPLCEIDEEVVSGRAEARAREEFEARHLRSVRELVE